MVGIKSCENSFVDRAEFQTMNASLRVLYSEELNSGPSLFSSGVAIELRLALLL